MSLARQDSQSSAGSGVSGTSGASSGASIQVGVGDADGLGNGQQDLTDNFQVFKQAVFGALYILLKERWETKRRYVIIRVCLEHLQLLLIILQARFLWKINYHSGVYKIANYPLLKVFLVSLGYSKVLIAMYALVAVIVILLGGCSWATYIYVKNNLIPKVWPFRFLRLGMSVFFHILYICLLNFFLTPLSCQFLSKDATKRNHLIDFPTQECSGMPQIIHMAVGAVFAAITIFVGGLYALGDADPNPVSQLWLASSRSEVEVKAWFFKTVIVLAANFLIGQWQVQSITILIASGWLAYVYVRWEPYYFQWTNHIRTGLYAMTAFVALMLTITTWPEDRFNRKRRIVLTTLTLALMPAAALVGALASYLRLRLSVGPARKAFSMLFLRSSLKDVYRFADEYQVELASRCCRDWTDYEDQLLNEDSVAMAESMIKAGLARFNSSAHIALLHVDFLLDVKSLYQTANSHLQEAKKLGLSLCDHYVVYVREQEHMQRLQTQTSSMESAVDLVGYVEFQRNYKMVLRIHKSSLFAIRSFWKQLLHSSITFRALVQTFHHIEACQQRAERTYKMVLERYPTNVKVLRAYARFLEDVKNDPWNAARYYSEADKLEENEGNAAEVLGNLGGDGSKENSTLQSVDEKNNAVCVINSVGTIQMANKVLLKMFGYRKGELEGKNVSLLMPAPFSTRHTSYLHNYVTTGKAKILDQKRQLVALHKERYVFPIDLLVTKVSGDGPDSIFMGVVQPSAEDHNLVKAWIMPGGTLLCMDQRFTDWLGKDPSDCVGRPLHILAAEGYAETLQHLMEQAAKATMEELQAGLIKVENIALDHNYADPISVDVSIEVGGTDTQRLFVANLKKRSEGDEYVLVADHKGRIVYVTNQLAQMLGYPVKQMVKMEFCKLMAQPFQQLHTKWMKNARPQVPLCSCRNGAPVVLVNAAGVGQPAKLQISSKEQGEEIIHVIKVKPVTFPVALDDRRITVTIDPLGKVLEVSNTPKLVFGFRPRLMVGRNLNHVVDVFEELAVAGGTDRKDMEHVIVSILHKYMEQKEASWRVGVHPPMSLEELASARADPLQASMLQQQTKAAVLQLEVQDGTEGQDMIIKVHLWRAETLTAVVELDKDGIIQKTGGCALHQPGTILGVASSTLLHTPLSRWFNCPDTYDGMLLDSKKKTGALKKKAADVKIGPQMHCSGRHYDGGMVHASVQGVVKAGAAVPRLVVKLTVEKPSKGDPNVVRHLLGLPVIANAEQCKEPVERVMEGPVRKPAKKKTGVSFGEAVEDVDAGTEDNSGDHSEGQESDQVARPHTGSGGGDGSEDNDWIPPPPKEPGAITSSAGDYLPPVETNLVDDGNGSQSGVDETSSAQEGGEDQGYHSDFKRGKRLRKLMRLMGSNQAEKVARRFYYQSVLVVLFLMVAHLACFIASMVLLQNQKTYIDEVDDAGGAVIAMHRMAIDCRVLDAMYRGKEQPGIFMREEMDHFTDLMKDATDKFETFHQKTYLGHNGLRRLTNTQKFKLQEFWESPMWEYQELQDISPPKSVTGKAGLWELGNAVIAAAREVQTNHAKIIAEGKHLSESRHWLFVMENIPMTLYTGYKSVLYGLVDRALVEIIKLGRSMTVLLVLEGLLCFMAALAYSAYLTRLLCQQRYNVFSIFLVIPTGFLRALSSKQVQLDEDADSDDDSEIGDVMPQEQHPEQAAAKITLSMSTSKGKKAKGEGSGKAGSRAMRQQQTSFVSTALQGMNPFSWFAAGTSTFDSSKKKLTRTAADIYRVITPLGLWGIMVIVVYGITVNNLFAVQAPFQELNMINFLVFRVTRGVLFALEMCAADTDAMKDFRRSQLVIRLKDFVHDYESFLYGKSVLKKDEVFVENDLSVGTPGLFTSADLANIFFRYTGCVRADQSQCYPPDHKFYDVTHHGVDPMANRFIQESQLLLVDDNKFLNLQSPRLEFLWQIGRYDFYDGMAKADHVFRLYVATIFDELRVAHVVVFVLSLCMMFFMLLAVIRPLLKRVHKEKRQVAELLCQLPPEMDVEELIREALADGDEDDKTGALIEKKPRTMDGMQEGMDAGMMMLENTDTGGGGGWSHLKNADGMPLRGRGGGVHEQPDAGSEYDD